MWVLLLLGLALPQFYHDPVKGMTVSDYHPKSFWYYPWGKSGTHKGVDIFASEGTPVVSATPGIVVYEGYMGMGGNTALVLGPKWRFHYYAHLQSCDVRKGQLLAPGESVGRVGATGNAAGKPPHLHYSVCTLLPYIWRIDDSPQGWKKMWYLDPTDFIGK